MFGLGDKNIHHFDFNLLQTDLHSHLIPGIDDGSPDMETSISMIRQLSELGYKKIITTPHIMWDMYKNSREIILEGLEKLTIAVAEAEIDIEINAGAEYFLDNHVKELLNKSEPLLTIGNQKVLVEFSLADYSMELNEILFELQLQGYQPVIAHPERYLYLERGRAFFHELKDAGYDLQLNILSLVGFYGKEIQKQAHYIAEKGFYDFAGTDLHEQRHLDMLAQSSLVSPLKKVLAGNNLRNESL